MERLIEGYRQFRRETWPAARARYETLARKGQHPETLVIACSDSRVDPATVFSAGPGELFAVRNIAGLVPPYEPDAHYHGTSAAVEYAVRVLKVARVVVLGHAQCGGVRALVEGAPAEARDFVEPWMSMARSVMHPPHPPHDHDHNHDDLTHYEVEVLRLSLKNLMSFPWVADAVADGRLQLHGFHFGIESGTLARLEADGLVPVT
jgi:carbonic anhydrase